MKRKKRKWEVERRKMTKSIKKLERSPKRMHCTITPLQVEYIVTDKKVKEVYK